MATIDARPLIAAGDAPFEPVPLEGVLGAQGFSYEAVELGAGDWQVTFRRQS